MIYDKCMKDLRREAERMAKLRPESKFLESDVLNEYFEGFRAPVIHHQITNLEEFKEIMNIDFMKIKEIPKIPFDKVFLEIESEGIDGNKIEFGMLVYKEPLREDPETFKDFDLIIGAFFPVNGEEDEYMDLRFPIKLDKLPRLYSDLHSYECLRCDKKNEIIPRICMKGKRFQDDCKPMKKAKLTIQVLVYLLTLLEKEKTLVPSKEKDEVTRTRRNAKTKRLEVIKISDKKYISEKKEYQGGTKSPHSRRGHWRHYKSGKKVWIEKMDVKGGSEEDRRYTV